MNKRKFIASARRSARMCVKTIITELREQPFDDVVRIRKVPTLPTQICCKNIFESHGDPTSQSGTSARVLSQTFRDMTAKFREWRGWTLQKENQRQGKFWFLRETIVYLLILAMVFPTAILRLLIQLPTGLQIRYPGTIYRLVHNGNRISPNTAMALRARGESDMYRVESSPKKKIYRLFSLL